MTRQINHRIRYWLVLAGLVTSPLASQELIVIGQEQSAIPAKQAISTLLDRFSTQSEMSEDNSRNKHSLFQPHTWIAELIDGEWGSSTLIPSTTQAVRRKLMLPLTTPICLIGTDAVSRHWLTAHRRELRRIGAYCFLTAALSKAELNSMQQLAHPVRVDSVPIDRLANQHGITTVPMLLMGQQREAL